MTWEFVGCLSMVYRTSVGELRTAETEASDSHPGLDPQSVTSGKRAHVNDTQTCRDIAQVPTNGAG